MKIDKFKFVDAIEPQVGASITGKYISMKHVLKAFIVVQVAQATADTVAITIEQSTAVAGTGHTAITKTVPIWSNLDTAASDTLVSRTAAVDYATDAGIKNKIVVFVVDSSKLDSGYDVLNVVMGASDASNIYSAAYVLQLRYSGADVDSD